MQKNADGFFEPAPPKKESGLIKSFYNVEVTLADQQQDPDSPLFSIKTFEELGLHEDLLKGVYDMGFSKPSKIQERALPLMLANPPTNMIGQSQSGTGKTAAFVLTMLSRTDFSINAPQALCLAPTRELARQIHSNLTAMGKFTPVQCELAIKDHVPVTIDNKITAHIVIGTPGTMLSLMKRQLDTKQVKVLVLDEADNMLDQDGLGDQTTRIKNMLPRGQIQHLLFSATFADRVRDWAKKFAPNANQIALKQEELSVTNIRQYYMDISPPDNLGATAFRGRVLRDAKIRVLIELYGVLTVAQTIVFCESREDADAIVAAMREGGEGEPENLKAKHSVQSLHGGKSGEMADDSGDMTRDQIIDSFRAGDIKVLIATNLLARGIDVLQVSLVINFDMPFVYRRNKREGLDIETYLHRIGRTGRFGKKGKAINFVHDQVTWNQMNEIETVLGTNIQKIEANPPEGVSLGEWIDEQLNKKSKAPKA